MKAKIMFIRTDGDYQAKDPVHLGLAYLVSSLRKEFGQDSIEFRIVDQDIEEEISRFRPDIVGITSVSRYYDKAIRYAKIAKGAGVPVIVGGVHISVLPSTLTDDMDVGVIGEGEETIIDLFDLFMKKGHFDRNELGKIDGIVFRRDDELIMTARRKPIEPLDRVPMPARDLFTFKNSTSMLTSRGCPYRCTFCATCRFWQNVRAFSPEYTVNEIKHLVNEYNVSWINFWDDLFILEKARLRRILGLLEKENILGKVSFRCSVRADLVNDEVAQLLEELNVRHVNMGLESGCSKTLKYLGKVGVTPEVSSSAVKILKKYGFGMHTSFIIGSPKETKKDILETLKFIRENQLLKHSEVLLLTPYPGTPIWDYAKKRKLVDENMDWGVLNSIYSENRDKSIILSEMLTREEIDKVFSLFMKVKRREAMKWAAKNPLKSVPLLLKALAQKIKTTGYRYTHGFFRSKHMPMEE